MNRQLAIVVLIVILLLLFLDSCSLLESAVAHAEPYLALACIAQGLAAISPEARTPSGAHGGAEGEASRRHAGAVLCATASSSPFAAFRLCYLLGISQNFLTV